MSVFPGRWCSGCSPPPQPSDFARSVCSGWLPPSSIFPSELQGFFWNPKKSLCGPVCGRLKELGNYHHTPRSSPGHVYTFPQNLLGRLGSGCPQRYLLDNTPLWLPALRHLTSLLPVGVPSLPKYVTFTGTLVSGYASGDPYEERELLTLLVQVVTGQPTPRVTLVAGAAGESSSPRGREAGPQPDQRFTFTRGGDKC